MKRLVEAVPSDDNRRWYVGHTLPRKEGFAVAHLARQGFETFLPRVVQTRSHAHKFETLKVALFPRYLFIRLDLTRDRWRSINGTMGMSYLVTARETPCPVPVGLVESLRQTAGSDDVVNLAPNLEAGDSVRLNAGPFAGQVGVFLRLDAKERVELLLELLNGQIRVKVARDLLELVA